MVNLLSNSIDAVNSNGQVRVRVSAGIRGESRGVRLVVADSGCGIPEKGRSNLFQPFFTTKKDVGTGLGLWVCKNIVDKHGGSIRVKSCTSKERSGTVISVFLPSMPPETISEAATA
jgi:signal transduction histidine kinase